MNVKFKYVTICVNVMLIHFGTNSGYIGSKYKDKAISRDVRVRRQAGYVYDKPTVSFDLPTATSIATTQAPTVDRIQMQMYYAYPVPASGDTANVGQQNSGYSAGSTTTSSASANGYSYEAQNNRNTQVIDTRPTLTETQNTAKGGYQNTAVVGTQAVVNSDLTGYGDGRPTTMISNSGTTGGIVSTSAPRYLPPQSSGENTGTVTTSNQAQTVVTITKPADSYIPPSVQVSSAQNDQLVTTQSVANAGLASANPNTEYLLPNPQPTPKIPIQQRPVQSGPVVPTQQYLPPVETPAGQKRIEGSVAAPASTYLPPVF